MVTRAPAPRALELCDPLPARPAVAVANTAVVDRLRAKASSTAPARSLRGSRRELPRRCGVPTLTPLEMKAWRVLIGLDPMPFEEYTDW